MDGLPLQLFLTKLFPQLRWTSSQYSHRRALRCNSNGRAPTYNLLLTKLFLNSDGRAPTIHTNEPFAATQMDGLLPTIHIEEARPSTQMDELLLCTLTSPSLQLRWTGSHLQFILTKLFPQPRRTSSYYTL